MAKQYVVTDVEMQALINSLELAALRAANHGPRMEPEGQTPKQIHAALTDSLHRSFHMVVVRWTQDIGYRGYSG